MGISCDLTNSLLHYIVLLSGYEKKSNNLDEILNYIKNK